LFQAASTIPIVFTMVSDPVGQGLVTNLARPGGTITGFTSYEFSLVTKLLEVLKELMPQASRDAIMFNPETAPYYQLLRPWSRLAPWGQSYRRVPPNSILLDQQSGGVGC
jgi:putative ABC transport system substrate-binding protein